jgi:hypothetical protein
MLYKITVGLGTDKDRQPLERVKDKLALVQPYLARVYGGFTAYRTTGGWVNGDGEYIEEPGIVFEIACALADSAKIRETAEFLRVFFRQSCVMVTESAAIPWFKGEGV